MGASPDFGNHMELGKDGGHGSGSMRFDAMQWRRDDGLIVMRSRGGDLRAFDAPEELGSLPTRVEHIEFNWGKRELTFIADGNRIDFETGSYRNMNPRRQRPAVYLDQNHMSTLSKAVRAPKRVSDVREWLAALKLISWAGSGRVVIPFSGAHMSETAAWSDDDARHHLAITILSVSRGWQLRDPLQQRADELTSLIHRSIGRETSVPSAVTLEPNAAIVSRVAPSSARDPEIDDVPALRHVYQSTLWFNVATAVMLAESPVIKGSLTGWTERVQRVTDFLGGLAADRAKSARRRAAAAFMFGDEAREAARAASNAGATAEQLLEWGKASWQLSDRGQPAVSVFRSAMIDKIVSGHTWEANDLTDLMYLSTAMGYCDYIAGDRRTVALLRQSSRRLGYGAEVHSSLTTLVDSLERRFANQEEQPEMKEA